MDESDRRARAGIEAAEWFVRLQADLPREERTEFVVWLRESPVHIAEMIRVAQVHGVLEKFDDWASVGSPEGSYETMVVPLPVQRVRPEPSSSLPQSPRSADFSAHRLLPSIVVVASVLLLMGGALLLRDWRGQVIETVRGERREVVLEDGTRLQIDPETRVRVLYNHEVRKVLLEAGRSLFHVAKSPNRPFLVQAGDTVVRAVGTTFGVDRESRDVIVTVTEGTVSVTSQAQGTAAAQPLPVGPSEQSSTPSGRRDVPSGSRSRPVLLTANQQLTVGNSGPARSVRAVDGEKELAWAEGRLIFHDDSIDKVIAEFNRYNHMQLSATDPALEKETVTGVFGAGDPEAFIAFLQTVMPVEITREGDDRIAIRSKPGN